MLEEFHAKPMKINRNNYDRKCQRNQETVISAINQKQKLELGRKREALENDITWNFIEYMP